MIGVGDSPKKSWKKLIDERRYPWIRIVNIPKRLSEGNTYLHIAAKNGQIEIFTKIINEDDDRNPKNERGSTPFLVACQYSQSELVKMLIKNSADLKIDLNARGKSFLESWDTTFLPN